LYIPRTQRLTVVDGSSALATQPVRRRHGNLWHTPRRSVQQALQLRAAAQQGTTARGSTVLSLTQSPFATLTGFHAHNASTFSIGGDRGRQEGGGGRSVKEERQGREKANGNSAGTAGEAKISIPEVFRLGHMQHICE